MKLRVIFILCFFIMLGIYFILVYGYSDSVHKAAEEAYAERETLYIESARDTFIMDMLARLTDLDFICDFIGNNADDPENIEKIMVDFANSKKTYEHIRFLDMDGNEIYVVEISGFGRKIDPDEKFDLEKKPEPEEHTELFDEHEFEAMLVSDADLQNRSSDQFFIRATELERDECYISELDLSIQSLDELTAYNPMVQYAQKVYDKNNELIGICVLDYSLENLLDLYITISNNSSADEIYLLNEVGYWLYSSNEDYMEFGFKFEEHEKESFQYIYPEIWEYIETNKNGSYKTKEGIYEFGSVEDGETIYAMGPGAIVVHNDTNNYIVTFSKYNNLDFGNWDSFAGFMKYQFNSKTHIQILLVCALIVFNYLIYMIFKWRMRFEKTSRFDEMTGAYHRQIGLTYAEALYKNCMNKGLNAGIIFCDLDNLKAINDSLGHEYGDRYIAGFAEAVVRSIRLHKVSFIKHLITNMKIHVFDKQRDTRYNDLFIRLGGDEFLIFCINAENHTMERVWERILIEFEQIKIEGVNGSVSHGICIANKSMELSLDQAISLADEKMYEEKEKNHQRTT